MLITSSQPEGHVIHRLRRFSQSFTYPMKLKKMPLLQKENVLCILSVIELLRLYQ